MLRRIVKVVLPILFVAMTLLLLYGLTYQPFSDTELEPLLPKVDSLTDDMKGEVITSLVDHLQDSSELVRKNSAFALAQIGKPAVPYIRTFIRSNAKRGKIEAAIALTEMGEAGSEAIPELLLLLKSNKTRLRDNAVTALGAMGKHAVVPLLYALDDDRYPKKDVAYALGQIGPEAEVATVALIDVLDHKNAEVRAAVIYALGQIYVEHKGMLPLFVKHLGDKSFPVRKHAVRAITHMGYLAVPELVLALTDENATVRANAAYSLGEITPSPIEAIPSLISVLEDRNAEVRASAVYAIGRISRSE